MNDQDHLFTVSEAARAVGISRSTIIRLEEAGFLTPRKTNPKSKFRYYDMDNIAQLGQYCILKRLGLRQEEIVSIYYGRSDAKEAIGRIEKELNQLKLRLEEYRIRYEKERHHEFSFVDVHDVTYYTAETVVTGIPETALFAYRTAESCVKAGYKTLLGTEPLSVITYGTEDASFDAPADSRRIMMCVPIDTTECNDFTSDENVRTIPGYHAFSLLSYGSYKDTYMNYAMLWQEVKERGLTPAGPARVYAIVAPYTGAHISSKDYVTRFVLPIK